MIHLRRKKKEQKPLDNEELRRIIREELEVHDGTLRDATEKERRKAILRKRLMNLPKNKKAQLLRYLDRKGVNYGKK